MHTDDAELRTSRRSMLTGIGAAGLAAAATGVVLPSAAGASQETDPAGTPTADVTPAIGVSPLLIAGLNYRMIDGFAFIPSSVGPGRTRTTGNSGVTSVGLGRMEAALDLPLGATLREITVYCTGAAAGTVTGLLRKAFPDTFYAFTPPGLLGLPASAGVSSVTLNVDQVVTENTVYALAVDLTAGYVSGVRLGYLAPPSAFVPLTPTPRVLDTRTGGGKLQPDEERIVNLGVPGFARGAVINLTITETQQAGFVAVFPANIAWPGNSSINWSQSEQNLANGVITGVDTGGAVRIRGGVAPTHVVIDTQGYLL